MFSLSILLLGIAVLSASTPAGNLQRRQGADVIYHCTVPNTAALTFDDGPYLFGTDISDALTNAGAKGTFFYNGRNWDCIYNPDEIARVKHVYGQGHQIGSHSWDHPNLATLSHDEINTEMARAEEAIYQITGAYPAFTRPPYGSFNDLVVQVAGERGQQLIIWDFDSGDSSSASADQQRQNYDNVIAAHPSTILTLNHETHETTAHQILPYAIQKLQAAGYRLVTVAECLGMQAYKTLGSPGTPNSTWHC